MLSYVQWNNAIEIRRGQLEDIEMCMKYRKLKIRGACDPEALKGNYLTDETKTKIVSDQELIKLHYIRNKLKDEIDYIEATGEIPPMTTDVPNVKELEQKTQINTVDTD